MSLGQVSAPTLKLLSVNDARHYLADRGWNTSPGTIYALVAAGKIRSRRYGIGRGTIRIAQSELDAYLADAEAATDTPKPPSRAPAGTGPLRNITPRSSRPGKKGR